MHWAYGILNGAQYGIVAESLPTPRIRYGLAFGATVWASDYVILPAAKLYQPLEVQPRDAGQRSQRAPCLRPGHGHRASAAVQIDPGPGLLASPGGRSAG
jgi:hypothetical protein